MVNGKMNFGYRGIDLINKTDEGYFKNDSLSVYLDRFIDGVKNLADRYDVSITTDFDELKKLILTGKKTKILKGKSLRIALSNESYERRIKAFKNQYQSNLKAFIGILNSLKKEKKLDIDIKNVVEPLLHLEVE